MLYYISINKLSNIIGYNDLYVEINYENQKRITTTIWNNNLPEWNEKFIIDVDNTESFFKIVIYEKNVWTKTQKIHEEKIKINNNNILTFNYQYLEISHGIPFKNKISNLNTENKIINNSNINLKNLNKQLNAKIKNLEEINNTLLNKNKYLKERNDSLKYNLLTKEDVNVKLNKTIDTLKHNFKKIKKLCDY